MTAPIVPPCHGEPRPDHAVVLWTIARLGAVELRQTLPGAAQCADRSHQASYVHGQDHGVGTLAQRSGNRLLRIERLQCDDRLRVGLEDPSHCLEALGLPFESLGLG